MKRAKVKAWRRWAVIIGGKPIMTTERKDRAEGAADRVLESGWVDAAEIVRVEIRPVVKKRKGKP